MNIKNIKILMGLMYRYNIKKIKFKKKNIIVIEMFSKNYETNTIKKKIKNKKYKTYKIKSPTIGIFFNSPSPNEKPFIKINEYIEKNRVMCIIESMKILYQVRSEYSGIVKKILVKNGDNINYNQDLFIIKNVQ